MVLLSSRAEYLALVLPESLAHTRKKLLDPPELFQAGELFVEPCGEVLTPIIREPIKNSLLGPEERTACWPEDAASTKALSTLCGAGGVPTGICCAALSGRAVLWEMQTGQPVLTGFVSPPCSHLQSSQQKHICLSASRAAQRGPWQPSEAPELTVKQDVFSI